VSKTKKLEGTVHHVDLEGGYYTLRLKNGDIFKLDGGDAGLRKAGQRVEVEGEVEDKGFGISFGTPILKVKKYTVVSSAN
jgi:hypothetical protein